jgi:hypothetical protein
MNTIIKQTSFMDASKRTTAFGGGYLKTLLTLFILFLSVGVWGQTTVTYTMQTGNFNSLQTERNNNPPYTGTYNNGATELAQYANGGSFGNTPGAAAFQTFTTTGNGTSGTSRALRVGDRFSITVFTGSNPSAGGRIGISFRNTTSVSNFFSSTDANTIARFQLDNIGGWKIYNGGTTFENTSATSGADRTLSIEITSSNTFNATIAGITYYDLSFAASGPIAQFCIYTFGDSNPNSFWKNASLTPVILSNSSDVWNSSSTWTGGNIPTTNSNVLVQNGHTVSLNINATISKLYIESGATFIASDSSPRTLTITKSTSGTSTTLSNSGTWQNGSGGSTIIFSGAPSSGDAIHAISGSIGFQNVTFSKTGGSSNIGVSFGANSVISGTLEIGSGGFVATAPPVGFYANSAILKFNQGSGAIYDVNSADYTWSSAQVPQNLTIASGTVNLKSGRNVNGYLRVDSGSNLTLINPGTLTINPISQVIIAGTANFGGQSVILKSDATGTATIGQITGSLTGATNVTVERYIPGKRAWRALTAPLKGSNTSLYSAWQNNGSTIANTGVQLWGPGGTGASGNGLASGSAYNIRRYTTSGWSDVTDTKSTNLFTTLANNAFMVFVTGEYGSPNIGNGQSAATTLKATGELITGTVNYSLSSTNHTLIGNPFASPISPAAILSNSANTNTALLFPYLWVWNPAYNTNGAYELYDKVAGTYSGGNLSAGTAIQSGQAFFVRTETAASSLTLTETMKSSSISNTFRNSNSIAPSIFRASFLKQTATDWMPLDGCIAAFYEGANQAADDADGKKMINTGENIGFVRNAVNLSSEHYPLVTAQDILNLKIWNTQQAHYKLKLNTEEFTMVGVEAWLQDLYTGTSQQLNLDGSVQEYEFDVDPTVSASSGTRFRIVFTNTALAVDTPTQGQLSIYPNPATGGKVTVSLPSGNFEGCSYQLINVLGQVVRQDGINNSNSSQVSISTSGLPNSWYALRIIKENSVVYQGKLIIKN